MKEKAGRPGRDGRLFLPYALFFASGFAALVYETVWARQLVLLFGATAPSASAIFAGFMGGMGLGSLLGDRLLRGKTAPLVLYGRLELGVAACAALFPLALKGIALAVESSDLPVPLLRLGLSWAAILPPAVLMGATFPVLARQCLGEDGREAGNLYAANLAGACLGVLCTAFFFLAFLGLSGAHWLAVGLNAAAGLLALALAGQARAPAAAALKTRPSLWPALAVFISGFLGMAFEVLWIRLLVPSFNNSAYGFATVLFVFLAGLGLGSWAAGRVKQPALEHLGGLLWLSAALGLAAYSLYGLTQLLQVRFADMSSSGVKPMILIPFVEALAVLLPLAVAQGMSLPLAVRLERGALGGLYFWNTAGAILGSLCVGFWWIPSLKVQLTSFVILAVAVLGGTALLWRPLKTWRAALAAAAALALFCFWTSLKGRYLPADVQLEWMTRFPQLSPSLLAFEEDIEGSVSVQGRAGSRFLVINGVGVTGYNNATKLLAHIPLLLHPAPTRALMICFGMGTTFRSALRHPVRLDAVEINGSVFSIFKYFYMDHERWTSQPRARLIANDGRNHLLRDKEGYDVILVDPSPPLYAAGTVNLYSRDFFELALRKLKPGGLLAVWLPEYPEPEFKMIMRSFRDAAPHSELWLGTKAGGGLVLLGSASPIPADARRVRERLKRAEVRTDLLELDREFDKEAAFWRLRLDSGKRFDDYVGGVEPVTDDFPRIEYPYFRARKPGYSSRPPLASWPSL